MKTYLVTGGAGFIGSNYIHYMFKKYDKDIRIINVDLLTYAGNLENLKDIEGRDNYTFIKADICDKKAIEKIADFAIGDAWMYWGWLDARDKGAKGYFVERGSSYPCDECQSHVGIFYPIEDEENRPQYHRNCCCYVVYSYVERYA